MAKTDLAMSVDAVGVVWCAALTVLTVEGGASCAGQAVTPFVAITQIQFKGT